MLSNQLFELLDGIPHLTEVQRQATIRSVLLYCLGRGSSGDLRSTAQHLGISAEISHLKISFLDRSAYTISQFWRVAFRYFHEVEAPTPFGPDTNKIDSLALTAALDAVDLHGSLRRECRRDMMLLEDLTVDDHRRLYREARVARFEATERDLYPLVIKLRKFCRREAEQRLQFIARHDPGLSIDDFALDLWAKALLVLRTYDSEYNELLLLNKAKKAVKRHAVTLIQHHTYDRRRRLDQTSGRRDDQKIQRRCGNCAFFAEATVNDSRHCSDLGTAPSRRRCRKDAPGFVARIATSERICGNCQHYNGCGHGRPCVERDIDPMGAVCGDYEPRVIESNFSANTSLLFQPMGESMEEEANCLHDIVEDKTAGAPDELVDQYRWLMDLLGHVSEEARNAAQIMLGQDDERFHSWADRHLGGGEDVEEAACQYVGISVKRLHSELRAARHQIKNVS